MKNYTQKDYERQLFKGEKSILCNQETSYDD